MLSIFKLIVANIVFTSLLLGKLLGTRNLKFYTMEVLLK